jgi:hypothetical protein
MALRAIISSLHYCQQVFRCFQLGNRSIPQHRTTSEEQENFELRTIQFGFPLNGWNQKGGL